MTITVKDKIYIPAEQISRYITDLAKLFTYDNPEYHERVRMGYSTTGCPPYLVHYGLQDINNVKHLVLPRGGLNKLKSFCAERNIPIRISDETTFYNKIDVELATTTTLSEQQLFINSLLMENNGGLIEAAPGMGKTIAMLGLIAEMKQPTLILMHEHRLRTQWEQEVLVHLKGSFKLGRLDGDKKEEGDIVIGLIQSAYIQYQKDPTYFSQFGCIITDECFTSNTKVLTDVGYKKIKSIKSGDKVLSYNEASNTLEYKKVEKLITKKTSKKLLHLRFTNGKSFICTSNHKIRTNSGWKEAQSLTSSDLIFEADYEFKMLTLWSRYFASHKKPTRILSAIWHNILLQRYKGWYRSRRIFSQRGETTRSKKSLLLRTTGLESCKVYKRRSFNPLRAMLKYNYVYDLTVEDNHNYIAEGIVVHNCHRIPSNMYDLVLNNTPAKYRIGVSGTIERKDGKHLLLFDIIGPVLHSIDCQDVKDRITTFNYTMIPTNVKIEAPMSRRYISGRMQLKLNYTEMITQLVSNEERNNLILENIVNSLQENYFPLILSDRVDHCNLIHSRLTDLGYKTVLLTGATRKKTKWEEIRKDDSIQAIVAQTKIAEEGLDYPKLSALHIPCPSSNNPKLKQRLARIRRAFPGKPTPMVYDYEDNLVSLKTEKGSLYYPLRHTAKQRQKFYIQLQSDYNS